MYTCWHERKTVVKENAWIEYILFMQDYVNEAYFWVMGLIFLLVSFLMLQFRLRKAHQFESGISYALV